MMSCKQLYFTAVLLLLTHWSKGQSQVVGPPQPVVAVVGEHIILPCHLEPAVDARFMAVEWTRPDLKPRLVLVWRAGQKLNLDDENPSYRGRTSLLTDKLKSGDISLKLSKVKLSDGGKYKCYVPTLNRDSVSDLVVGAVSSPVISLVEIDKDSGTVVLQCESKGWYPEPELLWLDAEGKILSAGPTETVRGPDDLYTVSSRVTVEKRHSNNITCRVQQRNINQTRETQIKFTDDFFNSLSSSAAATVGLGVSLAVCILLILLLVFFLWKIKNKIKSKTLNENDHVTKNVSKSKTKGQDSVKEEKEREPLNKRKKQKKNKHTDTCLTSQSSAANEIIVEVAKYGKYIRLRNQSHEEKTLTGWKLKLQVNNKKPLIHTFQSSSILQPGDTFTLWIPGYGSAHSSPARVWKDLKPWNTEDKLQFTLITNNREIPCDPVYV